MPPPSNAPSAVGAHSAPSSPSQPITCARQRIASAVATAPVANAPANASGTRDEVVDGPGDDQRAEQARRSPTAAAASEASVCAAALAQPHAGAEQAEREHAGERGPRALADPPARDRDRQQEREPGEHGEAAEPGQHAAAEEVLEVARGRAAGAAPDGGAGRGRRGGAAAAGRSAGAARRRRAAAAGGAAPRGAAALRGGRASTRPRPVQRRARRRPRAAPRAPPARRSGPQPSAAPSVDHRSIAHHTPLVDRRLHTLSTDGQLMFEP